MILKLIFTNTNTNIPVNNQKELNSYIHRILGKDNKYHDTFSNYAVSSLQGGKCSDGKTLTFNDSPYVLISTLDYELIETFMIGVQTKNEYFFDMKCIRVEPYEYNVNKSYDKIITISPILLKNKNNKKITFKDDEFLNVLTEQCKAKLKYKGIVDNTFKIEYRNLNKAKVKNIKVGNVFNICSLIGFTVYGKEETRNTLYNLGLGNSTGCGFGSIKIYE